VETSGFARRLGNAEAIQRLKRGDDPRAIGRQIEAETARFREQRRRYLIYR